MLRCERLGFDSPWRSYQQISLPPRAARANSVFHPSEVGKWVPDNTGANSESSTMRVAPIDQHRWYDRRLRTYGPGSVGRTHVNWVDGTSVHVFMLAFSRQHICCVKPTSNEFYLLACLVIASAQVLLQSLLASSRHLKESRFYSLFSHLELSHTIS